MTIYFLVTVQRVVRTRRLTSEVELEEIQTHFLKKNIPPHTPLQHWKLPEHESPLDFRDGHDSLSVVVGEGAALDARLKISAWGATV